MGNLLARGGGSTYEAGGGGHNIKPRRGAGPSMALGLAVLDFAIHYHIDFSKENIVKYFRWTTKDAQFWWALNADQTLHQFTYLILVAIALRV